LSDNWQQKRTKREKVSCETKLTSGNEADHNQGAMKEVKVKTTTERDKTRGPCHQFTADCSAIPRTGVYEVGRDWDF
jgi:hypothetical protein